MIKFGHICAVHFSRDKIGSRITEFPVIDAGKIDVWYTLMKTMVSLSETDSFEQFFELILDERAIEI